MNKELEQKYIQARGRGNVAINTVKETLKNRLAEVEKYHTQFSAAGPAECANILHWLLNDITSNLSSNLNFTAIANAQSAMAIVAQEMTKEPGVYELKWEKCQDHHTQLGWYHKGLLNGYCIGLIEPKYLVSDHECEEWGITNCTIPVSQVASYPSVDAAKEALQTAATEFFTKVIG